MDKFIVIDAVSIVLAGIGTGLTGAILGAILVVITVKRGPKGDRGRDGFPGATGIKGEPGTSGTIVIDEFKVGKFWIWRNKRRPSIKWEMM